MVIMINTVRFILCESKYTAVRLKINIIDLKFVKEWPNINSVLINTNDIIAYRRIILAGNMYPLVYISLKIPDLDCVSKWKRYH